MFSSQRWGRAVFLITAILVAGRGEAGERINHAGRILGPVPSLNGPLLFHTPEADAVASTLQILPRDNPWNEDVSGLPLLSNSTAMIDRIAADLDPARRNLRAFFEMNYVLVPDGQPPVPIRLFNYPDESDPPPYPIPANLPVETWPRETGNLTLEQWQRDVNGTGGDRHAIMVMPGRGLFWETWLTKLTTGGWEASNGARFELNSNALRPAGWTSADAAGLPMFPALVRFDEVPRGAIEHALRLVVRRTRREYLYPARHHASSPPTTDPDVPAMGQRLRLKASFAVPADWTVEEKMVLAALKRYGALVADNGGFFSVSVCPDPRFPQGCFDRLRLVPVSAFEVVRGTGQAEGPRSPGAPTADAGPDLSAAVQVPVRLAGAASGTNLRSLWYPYPGLQAPGAVTFDDPASLVTQARFSAPGVYTLILRAADGVHTPAFDAVVVTVGLDAKPPQPEAKKIRLQGRAPVGATVFLAREGFPGQPASRDGERWFGEATIEASPGQTESFLLKTSEGSVEVLLRMAVTR